VATISVMDIIEENKRLKLKNQTLEITCQQIVKEYDKLREENENKFNDLVKYEKEIEFLKQRNKDLRQKTWFQVYEENLKLAEEIKQYQYILQSVETFIGRFQHEKR